MYTWTEQHHKLQKTFKFNSFMEAINWMGKAAVVIDQLDHHPEWTNVYNKVHVTLTTHDAGNTVTEKDRELARLLDEISVG
jgi:4a-hydroxytetrahydrobiopterin dehydratase